VYERDESIFILFFDTFLCLLTLGLGILLVCDFELSVYLQAYNLVIILLIINPGYIFIGKGICRVLT
jgi:hypothetical protein